MLFWGTPTHADITEFSNFLLQLKTNVWEQNCVWLFFYFHFEKNYEVLKSMIFVEQKYKVNKNETKWKIQNSAHSFREMNHLLQLVSEL